MKQIVAMLFAGLVLWQSHHASAACVRNGGKITERSDVTLGTVIVREEACCEAALGGSCTKFTTPDGRDWIAEVIVRGAFGTFLSVEFWNGVAWIVGSRAIIGFQPPKQHKGKKAKKAEEKPAEMFTVLVSTSKNSGAFLRFAQFGRQAYVFAEGEVFRMQHNSPYHMASVLTLPAGTYAWVACGADAYAIYRKKDGQIEGFAGMLVYDEYEQRMSYTLSEYDTFMPTQCKRGEGAIFYMLMDAEGNRAPFTPPKFRGRFFLPKKEFW